MVCFPGFGNKEADRNAGLLDSVRNNSQSDRKWASSFCLPKALRYLQTRVVWWEREMTDQDFWFEPVSLLHECSLNEGLLWIWADRVPVSNAYREKNAFETLSEWECERLNIPPVPEGVRRVAHYQTEERIRRAYMGIRPKDALEYHVTEGLRQAAAIREF